ncbi:hypothetical protein MHU86_9765 [Fragilaria crotonensis]|nr:hypothetical protein MHU86_9765 [Fragilaria crotonensis]
MSSSDPPTTPFSQHAFSVAVEDGSIVEYTMRGLHEHEIGAWARFCASVFSYKPNPPPSSYFERHYRNDPLAEADLVRVILCNDGVIVSSCRIFQKEVSLGNGATVAAGGIGEVCTSAAHRRRGLSKYLLHNAMDIMKLRRMDISFLHAAPEFFPVYERGGGYASTHSEWSVATLQLDQLIAAGTDSLSMYSTRLAEFPKDTKRLQLLHKEYSEQKFAGCIVRSEEYWNIYLSQELDGALHVLEDNSKGVVAWMSLRQRGDRFQMREFGCDTANCPVELALPHLVKTCLLDFNAPSTTTIELHLPAFVLRSLGSAHCKYVQGVVEEEDLGWMYVPLRRSR